MRYGAFSVKNVEVLAEGLAILAFEWGAVTIDFKRRVVEVRFRERAWAKLLG